MTPKSLIAPARLARRPILATQADGRLVDLVRAGYHPAFEAIVTRYRRPLLRYVGRILPAERAEDAVQLAFVNAYEAMLGHRAELNLRPWLYRIAHNAALNALRDQGLRHDPLPESIDGVELPEQTLQRSQGLKEVVAAVKGLPERQRDAIVLRELEGRSYEEIADELGVSDGAVRQLLNRARNTLRAGATAVVPLGLAARLPWADSAEPVAARVAELCGGAGGGAVAAKVCATALVTGAVVGGVAVAPGGDKAHRHADGPRNVRDAAVSPGDRIGAESFVGSSEGSAEDPSGPGGRDEEADNRGGGGKAGDRSGPEHDGGEADSSGPGGGGEVRDRTGRDSGEREDSSGPGSAEVVSTRDDDSGSATSGSTSSSTSGTGTSGSSGTDDSFESSGSGSGSIITEVEAEPMSGTSGSGESSSGSGVSGSD